MSRRRDTIVVGASAGGVQTLRELLARLPVDLPAAVLVVQHQSSGGGGLAGVLARATRLPVTRVDEPQALQHGQVYIAPPDRHIVVNGERVLPVGGPRENRARPAIDPLFRTAAAARGSRVIGVLLTGLLDDGVAGLEAVKRCGGLVVVQDPQDAPFPQMPRHALETVAVDHVLPVSAMGERLGALTRQAAPSVPIPEDVAIEARLSGPERSRVPAIDAIGEHVSAACPECGGPLWRVGRGKTATYRCHVGHALSARALLESQSEQIEQALWAAVRALTERAAILDKLADDAEPRAPRVAAGFRSRAAEARTQSEQARQFLLSLEARATDEPGAEPRADEA